MQKKEEEMNQETKLFHELLDIFGLCCCGGPEDSLLYILEVMCHLAVKYPKNNDVRTLQGSINVDNYMEEKNKRENKLFIDAGQMYWIYALLTERGLLEHGFALPGWFTASGENALEKIIEWWELYEKRCKVEEKEDYQ